MDARVKTGRKLGSDGERRNGRSLWAERKEAPVEHKSGDSGFELFCLVPALFPLPDTRAVILRGNNCSIMQTQDYLHK